LNWLVIPLTILVVQCASRLSDSETFSSYEGYCPPSVPDKGDGWDSGKTCRIAPPCRDGTPDDGTGLTLEGGKVCRVIPRCTRPELDSDGDGWGWDGRSCRVTDDDFVTFDSTYYPYHGEEYDYTTCGVAKAHDGMYLAVTEESLLWKGRCQNDSWGRCANQDCLSKWDRIPADAKRESNGYREVREPRCEVPCGKRILVLSQDRKRTQHAVIYDACPSGHWNNRYKEATEGRNPCAAGSLHVDLRVELFRKLSAPGNGDNIKILISRSDLVGAPARQQREAQEAAGNAPPPAPTQPPASTSPTPAPPKAPSFLGIEVSLRVKSEWEDGYCADLVVKNPSTNVVNNWSVDLDLKGARLSQKWNLSAKESQGSVTLWPTPISQSIMARSVLDNTGFCVAHAPGTSKAVVVKAEGS